MSKTPTLIGILTGMLFLSTLSIGTANATVQGEQRRAARDVRQDTRDTARDEKHKCIASNNKSNHECRQDKRQKKQDGRQTARDIKY